MALSVTAESWLYSALGGLDVPGPKGYREISEFILGIEGNSTPLFVAGVWQYW